MPRANLSVCMIVRDEEAQLENCLRSFRDHVEELVVVDTGSKDRTPEIAKKYADVFETYTRCNEEYPGDVRGLIWSFADARNRSFSLGTRPYKMWIDGDDELRGAEKLPNYIERLDRARGGQPVLGLLPYEYGHDHKGNCTCLQRRERVCSPGEAFHWDVPVHEVLMPKAGVNAPYIDISEDIRFIHRRKASKPGEPGRNLRILKGWHDKHGDQDARMLYYLGLAYGDAGDLHNAIQFLQKYVEKSGWDDEKCMAQVRIARSYEMLQQYDLEIEWGLRAIATKPTWFDGYYAVTRAHYFKAMASDTPDNWQKCAHWGRLALSQPATHHQTLTFSNPMEREVEIHIYMNLVFNKVGDVKAALESAEKVIGYDPNMAPQVVFNRRRYVRFLARGELTPILERLVQTGANSQHAKDAVLQIIDGESTEPESRAPTLEKLIQMPPSPVQRPPEPSLSRTANLDIVLACGDAWEPWNPRVVEDRGMGGSETAVVEVCKRLAAKGHRVRVFTSCGEPATYDGVQYCKTGDIRSVGSCDVLVAWRHAEFLQDPPISAKARLLWVHDVYALGANHMRLLRADRVLGLSAWHKDLLARSHNIPESQVQQTRNGIDLARFDQNVPRNPHKAVCSSSPDRYLPSLLSMWPRIRARVPDAELHVFYGFFNWRRSAEASNDHGQLGTIASLERQLQEMRPHGVVFRDRVNPKELAREFLSAGVWTYPTWFSETSCISAMEAQAAGLRLVTSPIAALNETVGARGTLIPGDWLSPTYQDMFVNSAVAAMLKPGDEDRAELQRYAREHFSWDGVVEQWVPLMRQCIEESAAGVLPPYRAA